MRRLLLTISFIVIFLFGCSDDPSAFQENQGKVINNNRLMRSSQGITLCYTHVSQIRNLASFDQHDVDTTKKHVNYQRGPAT